MQGFIFMSTPDMKLNNSIATIIEIVDMIKLKWQSMMAIKDFHASYFIC